MVRKFGIVSIINWYTVYVQKNMDYNVGDPPAAPILREAAYKYRYTKQNMYDVVVRLMNRNRAPIG